MNYRISDKMAEEAKKIIANDEIKERLIVLKNQLDFLGGENDLKKTFNEEDVKFAKEGLNKIKNLSDTLNFKKQNLQVLLNNALSKLNITESVKIKTELKKIDEEINDVIKKEKEYNSVLVNDLFDYKNQMALIKDKYDNVDIVKNEIIDDSFSSSVIADYKKERASNLVVQFLDSLSEDKRNQVLNENENLRGYLNVGENI